LDCDSHWGGIILAMSLNSAPLPESPSSPGGRSGSLLARVGAFPWKSTALLLRARFREDHLALTASSLTFTTTIALVPFITVALAVFTAFPMFAKFQDVLQKWLIESLIPDNIARQVLGYLTQFAGKASKLGAAGLVILLTTALALFFTIDRTLNAIWRVPKPRPFAQRVLVYWAAITLGPLLLGASLTATSYALTASRGIVGVMPGGLGFALDLLQFALMAGGMAALYYYVPNTRVRWGHAWTGGVFVAAGFELAKKLLAVYLAKVPTYSLVYGAFATLPILLIWIYVAWIIVLLGAVIAASLPGLQSATKQRPRAPGQSFQLALETLQALDQARSVVARGLTSAQLAGQLRVTVARLEPVLATLRGLDWVAPLEEPQDGTEPRLVLLVDPDATPLAPLLQALLLKREPSTENLWQIGRWPALLLRDAL
jgi:membrane protein